MIIRQPVIRMLIRALYAVFMVLEWKRLAS
jgi:hypothetical protein